MTAPSSTASEVAEAVQKTHAASSLSRYKTEMLAAFRYLDAVKLRFDPPMPGLKNFNHRIAYNEFFYIMAEFKEQRIDVTEVVNRAKELFAGHTDLIQGLGRFLPNGGSQYFGSSSPPPELHLQVALKAIQRQRQATSIKATALVHKIRALFSVQTDKAQQEVYKNYVAIFNEYMQGITSIQEMYTQLSQLLLAEYPDLLAELAEFFPESVRSA
jgi:histone deacetylase complex regulatory component SIN3